MKEISTLSRLEDIPEPVPETDFVVVDVIISSTTIIRLLEAGAEYVRPFQDPETAQQFKRTTADALLVGEDGGGPIEGRPVGIRTSNGTRAMDRIGVSDGLFVGSTINASAVASAVENRERDLLVVAAGRHGEVTPEDNAGATLIESHCKNRTPNTEALREQVRTSGTADWLREIGYGNELAELLTFDSSETVPRLEDGVFVAE